MRREIVAFGSYYKDFMATLHDKERRKVLYVLSLLEREKTDFRQNSSNTY